MKKAIIKGFIFYLFLATFTGCKKHIDRSNLIEKNKSIVINKTDDTLFFVKTYSYGNFYNDKLQILPPDSLTVLAKGGVGLEYFIIYKKNDTINPYIKFTRDHTYNYKKNIYNYADWETMKSFTVIEHNGTQYYKVIINNFFYLTKENIINP